MAQANSSTSKETLAGKAASEDWLTLNLSVLGVREDESWCAIALEMSLRGYGETFDAALESLVDAV